MYINLFNACYYCEDSAVAMKYAADIKKDLDAHNGHLGVVLSHTMMKAYGRHGSMEMVLEVADKAMMNGKKLGVDFFFHLLLASKFDKKRGLFYIIQVLYFDFEDMQTSFSDRSPAYHFTIKISRFIDISTIIKKFLPILQFGLWESVFVDTLKLLPASDTIIFAKKAFILLGHFR